MSAMMSSLPSVPWLYIMKIMSGCFIFFLFYFLGWSNPLFLDTFMKRYSVSNLSSGEK